jgi:hypothetical protein
MDWACSTHGRDEKCIQYFGWKTERKRLFGRHRSRWEDNIGMDIREIGWEIVNLMHLAQDREQWQVVVNMVMNLWVQ